MRKIILDLAVTLDGFIEGANGEIDWCIMDDDMGFENFLDDIDTIFYGRISYELWGQFQPADDASMAQKKLMKKIHSKDKYVFSKTQKEDDKATYISSVIAEKVNEIKNKPGKNIWLYGGSKLITTFIDEELIDEYRLFVHPIILGKGKPVFGNIKTRVGLTLNYMKTFKSGVVLLCYDA